MRRTALGSFLHAESVPQTSSFGKAPERKVLKSSPRARHSFRDIGYPRTYLEFNLPCENPIDYDGGRVADSQFCDHQIV